MALRLASKSAARRAMLAAAGVPFDPIDSGWDEDGAKAALRATGMSAVALASALADGKALGAAAAPNDLVLGADQLLECDNGTMLDKPASRNEAFEQLRRLSGRTHRLHSAAAVAENGTIIWRKCESVALTMRTLSDDFLGRYLDAEYSEIRWCVGGYRIEGPGAQLFDRIEGSHFAILGLPLLPLLGFLRGRGVVPA